MLAWGQTPDAQSLWNQRAQLSKARSSWLMGKRTLMPLGLTYKMPTATTAVAFRGNIVDDEAWQDTRKYGIYDFSSTSPQLDCIYEDQEGILHSEYGGCVIGDTFHYILAWTNSYSTTIYCKYAFNLESMTWDVDHSYVVPDQRDLSILAWSNTPYDKSTGRAYGCFFDNRGVNLFLGSIKYDEELKMDPIIYAPHTFIVMAINDADGQLYGISSGGGLYHIDKQRGGVTFIGATGINPSVMHQAADIDSSTGHLYWTFIDNKLRCGLACVNLEDGSTTICYEFDRFVQFGDIFITNQGVRDDAPAKVADLEWKPNPDDCDRVDVSFTMPTLSNNGAKQLSGSLTYVITLGENDLLEGVAAPGEHVNVTLAALPVGQESHIGVKAVNDVGEGSATYIDVWAGLDIFSDPKNVSLSVDGTKATLAWDAVTSGVHGGYADISDMMYHVYLIQAGGAQEVAVTRQLTHVIDIDPEQFGFLMMGVRAARQDDSCSSALVSSNRVQLGEYMVPPKTFLFNDSCNIGGWWQSIDRNGDGRTWTYDEQNACMFIRDALPGEFEVGANNDWLRSVPIFLEANLQYTIRLSGCFDKGEVRLSQEGDSNLGEVVLTASGTDEAVFEGTKEGKFIAANTGVYRLAIGETGVKLGIRITGFSISEGVQQAAPQDVEDLVVTPAPRGEKKAAISFKAPAYNVINQPINSISYVEIARDGKNIATLYDVTPGQAVTFTDNGVKKSDLYTYAVRAVTSGGTGGWKEAVVYVGLDVPGKPGNVTMADMGDGSYLIRWQTSEVGQHGGFVNVDSVQHFVYEVADGQVTTQLAVVEQGDSFVGTADLNGEPGWFHRAVTAVCPKEKEQPEEVPDGALSFFDGDNAGTVPEDVISNGSEVLANGFHAWEDEYVETEASVVGLIKGTPVGLPFDESFAGKAVGQTVFWWSKALQGEAQWQLSDISMDEDDGSMAFCARQQGDKAVVGTRKLTLQDAMHPTLLFWYRADAQAGGSLSVEVDGGQRENSVAHVADIILDEANADGGWHLATVDLTPYQQEAYVIISFVAEGLKPGATVALDKVSIEESRHCDLSVEVMAPEEIFTSKVVDINVVVTNHDNSMVAESYTVMLSAAYQDHDVQCDTILLEQVGGDLQPNGSRATYTAHFSTTPFIKGIITLKAVVVCETDEITDNNEVETTMLVRDNEVPNIVDLTATVENGNWVTLSWSNPPDNDVVPADSPGPISGYRVYVDGVLYSEIENWTESALVGPFADGAHEFHVTVLYGPQKVESPLSNMATIVTAIRQLMSDGPSLNTQDVTVFAPNGTVVADGIGVTARLPKGFYVVRVKATGSVISFLKH